MGEPWGVSVLGALEVTVGPRTVDLGARRNREVLAALAVDAGRVVPTDVLLDRVWGAEGASTTNLHAVLSRLRARLADAGIQDALETRAPGYVLQVSDDQVDAVRFGQLLATARRLQAAGDPAAARSAVQDALDLWRGRAYADIRSPFSELEAARLEEQRVAAVELGAELDLALGRHADVVDDLMSLVAEHPLREGLRGALMVALYRTGRQADALATYEQGRALLADELGLDPGPELQRLHQLVLRQDPALLPPADETPTGDAPAGHAQHRPAEESFGALLRRLRERAGLSQQALAEAAGLTPHAVSALERGTRTRPYPHTVRSLGDALGCTDAERSALLAAVPRRRNSAPTTEVPPARPDRPAGLVVPPTHLFGRADDVSALLERLASGARLVTLVGPGGVGKTRLAAAVSQALAEHYPDGIVQVSLAPVADASDVVATVARAAGLAGGDDLDALAGHLAPLRMLLVLDNFEHLLSAAPSVGRLVALCPHLAVLVSSRSPLRLRAEQEYAVQPLGLPPSDAATVEELASAPAGALLLDRARAVAPRVGEDPGDVPALAELCHRLAGLPLAIELATARLRMLPPRALLDRLESALSAAGARDLPERQRTMRATLDWSHGLLTPEQQRMFTLLGAFRGGADLGAVEAVAEAGDGVGADQVLGLLEDLVAHSLVRVTPGPEGSTRFGMLEPVAEYARSLLVGDRAERILRAHLAFFVDLARQAAVGYERADQVSWLARTEADEANLVVAVERALDLGDPDSAGTVTWSMWLYWWLRGGLAVGRRLAEQCLAHPLAPGVRPRVNLTAATMAYAAGDHAAAAAAWAEADRLGVELGDAEVLAKARAGTGLAVLAEGDLALASARFAAALDFCAQAGEQGVWLASLVHVWLGTVLLVQGDPEAATVEIRSGLDIARRRGDRLSTYVALYNLSQVALAQDDDAAARRHVQEGIELSEQTGDLANLAYFLETLAVVESRAGSHTRVATLLGASDGLREAFGSVYGYYLPDESLRASAEGASRQALGEDGFDDALDRGRAMEPADALGYARQGG